MILLLTLLLLTGCLRAPVFYPAILYDWPTCAPLIATLTPYDCSEIVNKRNALPPIYRLLPQGPLICLPASVRCRPLVLP